MIRHGLLNPAVLSLLARVRHTNTLVLADRGFPFWREIETIDLSLVDGVPIAPSVTEIHEGEEIQQPAESIVVTDIPETDNYLARFEDRVLEFHRYL